MMLVWLWVGRPTGRYLGLKVLCSRLISSLRLVLVRLTWPMMTSWYSCCVPVQLTSSEASHLTLRTVPIMIV